MTTHDNDERVAFSLLDFCKRNSIGRGLAYKEMNSGRLPYRKCGRRVVISLSDERRWLEALPVGPTRQPDDLKGGG